MTTRTANIAAADIMPIVAASYAIHPDWDADTHLSYLVNDAFALESEDDMLYEVGWVTPYAEHTARTFVEFWLRNPHRTLAMVTR